MECLDFCIRNHSHGLGYIVHVCVLGPSGQGYSKSKQTDEPRETWKYSAQDGWIEMKHMQAGLDLQCIQKEQTLSQNEGFLGHSFG